MEAWRFGGNCSGPAQLLRLSIPAAPAAGGVLVSLITPLRSVGLAAAALLLALCPCLVCPMRFAWSIIYATIKGFLCQFRRGWCLLADSGKCGTRWVGGSNPLFARLLQTPILGVLPIPSPSSLLQICQMPFCLPYATMPLFQRKPPFTVFYGDLATWLPLFDYLGYMGLLLADFILTGLWGEICSNFWVAVNRWWGRVCGEKMVGFLYIKKELS